MGMPPTNAEYILCRIVCVYRGRQRRRQNDFSHVKLTTAVYTDGGGVEDAKCKFVYFASFLATLSVV